MNDPTYLTNMDVTIDGTAYHIDNASIEWETHHPDLLSRISLPGSPDDCSTSTPMLSSLEAICDGKCLDEYSAPDELVDKLLELAEGGR